MDGGSVKLQDVQSSSQIVTVDKPTHPCHPTNSVGALEEKCHIPRTYSPRAHLGVFHPCLGPLKAPGYIP